MTLTCTGVHRMTDSTVVSNAASDVAVIGDCCPSCGGVMIGDSCTMLGLCEYADSDWYEPDTEEELCEANEQAGVDSMNDLNLIIAGGRDFTDQLTMATAIKAIINSNGLTTTPITLVCGMAAGADMTGCILAKKWNWPVAEYPADWKTHGKSAGPIRNKQMADNADALIAFWDGKSRGTANMIRTMEAANKPVIVIPYGEQS